MKLDTLIAMNLAVIAVGTLYAGGKAIAEIPSMNRALSGKKLPKARFVECLNDKQIQTLIDQTETLSMNCKGVK